ncbi:MAG: phosphotransferase [Sphingomonadaceae bacterium]
MIPPIPATQNDITPEWMTAALSSHFPDVEVTALTQTKFIDGTAQKLRFSLEFAPGRQAGVPTSLWVKGGFDTRGADQGEAFANEVRFFRDIAPLLQIERPAAYYGEVDRKTRNGVVILEDLLLRGATFGDSRTPLHPDQTAALLSLQAQYHARFWNDSALDHFTWLKAGGAMAEANMVDQYFSLWDSASALPRFAYLNEEQRDRPRMQKALNTMVAALQSEAICLIHGDSGVPNVYFTDANVPGYLDWQHTMKGHWAFDLAALVITSLTVDDRRISEVDLLKHYLSELQANGVDAPCFDSAWLDYRRFAIWPFMWVMCPPTVHPEEVCSLLSQRAVSAIADLDTVSALQN